MSLIPGFKPPQPWGTTNNPGNFDPNSQVKPQALPGNPNAINLANPFNQKIPGASPPPFPTNIMSMNGGIPSANIPQPPKPVDESYRNLAAPDQFKLFQSDPNVAQHEYGRISDAMNLYKASGDTNGYNAANDWMNKFNTATGGAYRPPDPATLQFQQQQQQQSDIMKQLQNFKPANYDPNTDPAYQAYKQLYANQAQDASRSAMEDMNSRGLLNSSMTAGEVAKAQQDANLQLAAKSADLGQQFYNRQQDQFNNQAKIVGLLGDQQQRSLDNQHWNQNYQLQQNADQRAQGADQRAAQQQTFTQNMQSQEFTDKQRQEHVALAQALTQAYGVPVDPKEDPSLAFAQVEGLKPINMQQLEIAKQNAASQEEERKAMAAYREAEARRQDSLASNQISTNNRVATNAENTAHNQQQQRLIDIWRIQGKAPAGIDGVEEGKPYTGQEKPIPDGNKPANLNPLISQLNKTYSEVDSTTGKSSIPEKNKQNLRNSIIMMNLSDADTDRLLGSFGLPTN